jgi:hypothetical protein
VFIDGLSGDPSRSGRDATPEGETNANPAPGFVRDEPTGSRDIGSTRVPSTLAASNKVTRQALSMPVVS